MVDEQRPWADPIRTAMRCAAVLSCAVWCLVLAGRVDAAVAPHVSVDPNASGRWPIDLSLLKTVDHATPPVGSSITFTLTLSNKGASTRKATQIKVVDRPVPGLSFQTFSAPAGTTFNTQTLEWSIPELDQGGEIQLHLVFTVQTSGTLTNCAEVTAAAEPDADSTPGNADWTPEDDDACVTIHVPTPEAMCYLVADNDGILDSKDAITTTSPDFFESYVGMTGTKHLEAIAFDPKTGILYGADASRFGSIDLLTGGFTEIGPFGSGNGSEGSLDFSDVDGLSLDPFTGIMYASVRRSGLDLLIQVDPLTGAAVEDAFGAGETYVAVPSINNLDDIDDIAVSSVDGTLYAILNENGQSSRLITINKQTGVSVDVTDLDVENVEGLGFHPDGRFLGVLGNGHKQLVEINPADGSTTLLLALGVQGFKDYEGVACLTEPQNTILGSVFLTPRIDLQLEKKASGPDDWDAVSYALTVSFDDTILAQALVPLGGTGAADITVDLFEDENGNGTVDAEDAQLASTVTDGAGAYRFDISASGSFIVRTDLSSIPNLAVTPSNNAAAVEFSGFGITASDIDFSFFEFVEATSVSVKDLLPAGISYVSHTATAGSYNAGSGIWTVGTLSPGASAMLTIGATQQDALVTNCAEIKHAGEEDLDSTPDNGVPAEDDLDCATTNRTPKIDLSLEKIVDVAQPAISATVTYALTVSNSEESKDAATGIVVTDVLPPGVTFVTSVPGDAVYDPGTRSVTWAVGALEIGASAELLIRVTADLVGSVRNCAEITAADQSDVDSTPANGVDNSEDDQACATFEVIPAPEKGSIGDLIFNDVNADGVHDPGEPGLAGVLVRLHTGACGPEGSPAAVRVSSQAGAYLFAGLEAGSYCVDVLDSSVPEGFTLTTANDPMSVELGSGEHFLDADFGYVAEPEFFEADLELTKSVSTSSPAINDVVTFTITLANRGPANATNVTVRDVIPAGLVYIDATPSQGYFDTMNGFWGVGTLPVYESVTLQIRVRVVVQNMIENIAQVIFVDQTDPDSTPGNGVPEEDDQDNAIVEARGPGGVGDILRVECADVGTVNALAFDARRNILLAGSEAGRIHVSTDEGANWPQILVTNTHTPVRDIVVSASGAAYAASLGDGAYVSDDGGTTWESIGPPGGSLDDLDVDDATETVYAAGHGRVLRYDGSAWSEVGAPTNPFGSRQVIAVVYDASTGSVFASTFDQGVFRFSGGVWASASNGLPIGAINVLFRGPGNEVLAGTNNDGIFAFDSGTWTRFGTGLEFEPIESIGSGPNGELVAGGRESAAYFFNHLTNSWLPVGNLPIYTVTSITVDGQSRVYAGAPGEGIYQIHDTDLDGIPDLAYQVANYLTTAVIQDLVVAPNGDLFAATYGYGVLYSDDGGTCWTRMNRGLENLWVYAISRQTDGTLFIGIWADGKGGIWRSEDNGRNWELVAFPYRQIVSLAIDPSHENIIYAGVNLSGTGSIYRTTDDGDTWTVMESFVDPVWSIDVDPANSNHVLVGTLGDGVWESVDAGISFEQIGSIATGLGHHAAFEVAFAPLASPYAGDPFAGTGAGVYRYDSGSGTWSLFGTGSESHEVRTLVFTGALIFAGTWDDGILEYNIATNAWDDFGLADIPVVAFAVHYPTETLVIGTAGHGLFLAPHVSITTDIESTKSAPTRPVSFGLSQAYPNPFNPRTTIPFEVQEKGRVSIGVFDVLGRQIATLVDGYYTEGRYEVAWEAGSRPSGTYVVRMDTDSGSQSQTVSLLK